MSKSLGLIAVMCMYRLDRGSDSEAEDVEHAEKLRQVKAVLEEVISFLDCFSLCCYFLL